MENKTNLKFNSIYTADVVDINTDGDGVCKIEGNVVFVSNALIGENVQIKIIEQKNAFAIGKVHELIKISPDRTEPFCPYFNECGGCSLQHLKYEKQLEFKKNQVANALKKIAKIDFPVSDCVSSTPFYYRNKIAFNISKNGKVALKKRNSHENVEIDNCLITQTWVQDLINILNEYIEVSKIKIYDEHKNTGLLKNIVVRAVDDSLLITFAINGNTLPKTDLLIPLLKSKFEKFGVNININKMKNQIILSNQFQHIYGLQTLKCNDFDIEYEISSGSFMQVNDLIKNKIYKEVLDNIFFSDIVIDAYSGAGLLSAIISNKCKECHGIEIINQATKNAEKLKKLNNISNLFNHNGDCAEILPKLVRQFNNNDLVVVLDPPRKGCEKNVIDTLNKLESKKIIYISCNPQTLSRDLSLLTQFYKLKSIQPYDMFPQTQHVETVVILQKK